jgi:Helix-turn-helix domain
MLGPQIQEVTELRPAYLRIADAIKYSGIGRSTLYSLMTEGRIKSVALKTHKDNVRGLRLISRESLDSFLGSLMG